MAHLTVSSSLMWPGAVVTLADVLRSSASLAAAPLMLMVPEAMSAGEPLSRFSRCCWPAPAGPITACS